MLIGLSIAFAVIVLDQLSKYWILEHVLETYRSIEIAPFFNIVNAWNTGVSFSMFSDSGATGVIVLSAIALLVVAGLLWWLKKEQSRMLQVALGLIIGEAIGNVIDRIRIGAVFDFLDFHLFGHHWPAFNLADSAICVGAIIILIDGLFFNKKGVDKK